MPEEITTHKEKIYEILKKTSMGTPLPMTLIAQEVGCTLSHLSTTFRMAKEAEFLSIHEIGDYTIRKMPETYKDFKDAINEKTNKYRKETRGTRRPRRKGFDSPPEKIEIDNILSVIDDLIRKSVELEQLEKKYASLLSLTKKYKKKLHNKGS